MRSSSEYVDMAEDALVASRSSMASFHEQEQALHRAQVWASLAVASATREHEIESQWRYDHANNRL